MRTKIEQMLRQAYSAKLLIRNINLGLQDTALEELYALPVIHQMRMEALFEANAQLEMVVAGLTHGLLAIADRESVTHSSSARTTPPIVSIPSPQGTSSAHTAGLSHH